MIYNILYIICGASVLLCQIKLRRCVRVCERHRLQCVRREETAAVGHNRTVVVGRISEVPRNAGAHIYTGRTRVLEHRDDSAYVHRRTNPWRGGGGVRDDHRAV